MILPPSKTSVPFSITGPLTGWIVALVSAIGCFCGAPGISGLAAQMRSDRQTSSESDIASEYASRIANLLMHCPSLTLHLASLLTTRVTTHSLVIVPWQNSSCRGQSSHSSGCRSPARCIAWPESRTLRIRAARILACSARQARSSSRSKYLRPSIQVCSQRERRDSGRPLQTTKSASLPASSEPTQRSMRSCFAGLSVTNLSASSARHAAVFHGLGRFVVQVPAQLGVVGVERDDDARAVHQRAVEGNRVDRPRTCRPTSRRTTSRSRRAWPSRRRLCSLRGCAAACRS